MALSVTSFKFKQTHQQPTSIGANLICAAADVNRWRWRRSRSFFTIFWRGRGR